nr:uncharacterized protein LOC122174254 [Chrysemys picta bellii]
MGEQRAYEGLDKKALKDLCSEKGISFRKKATNQELRDLLMASDQKAEAIEKEKAASKLQLEHEQRLAEIRLQELEAEAKVQRFQLQVKKAREEKQKLYPLESPVHNNVGMLYNSEQLSGCNQMYPSTATFYVNAFTVCSVKSGSITCANAMYGSGNEKFPENVKVNGKSCLGQIMASNITLVKADLVKEEDYLPNQSVNVVVLYEFTVRVPLARIHLEWNGAQHEVIAGVRKLLPKDLLIGENVKALFSPGSQSQDRNDVKPELIVGNDLPGEGCSKGLSEKSYLSVNEVSEYRSSVSEVNLELNQEQQNLIGQENVSLEQIKVDGQVEALTEEGKGGFWMGDALVASTACKSEPEKGNCDLLGVAQCSKKSSLSVGSGKVPGKEAAPLSQSLSVISPVCWDKGEEGRKSLEKPRQPCELMALSSQQFGKAGIVEDKCSYTLPVSCVENSDSEGNVPVSVPGIDLPMEEATSVSKQLSVNSPVC